MNLKKTFTFSTGDLVEAQKASFYRFLIKGIGKELNKIIKNPYKVQTAAGKSSSNTSNVLAYEKPASKNKKDLKKTRVDLNDSNSYFNFNKKTNVYVYPYKIKIKGPSASLSECVEKSSTYSANIYILGELAQKISSNKELRDTTNESLTPKKATIRRLKTSQRLKIFKSVKASIKKHIFATSVPFLTEDGSFYVSGCERVVVSQILKSPGLYFKNSYTKKNGLSSSATFVSENWVWTRFVLEPADIDINAKAQKKSECYNIFASSLFNNKSGKEGSNKINIISLILNLGFSVEDILTSSRNSSSLNLHKFKQENISKDYNFSQFLSEIDKNKFVSDGISRLSLNLKLDLDLSKKAKMLTALDLIKISDKLIEFHEGESPYEDIDNLQNKLVKGPGELLQGQISRALNFWLKNFSESEKVIKIWKSSQIKSLEDNLDINDTIKSHKIFALSSSVRKLIQSNINSFFFTSPLSQYYDETNPLAELTHKRRISVFGPGGLNRENASSKVRDIHPSQYGKLCTIETPEGENAGLVMALANYARIGEIGSIDSPYFAVSKNKDISKIVYLNSFNESQAKTAFYVEDKNLKALDYLISKNNFDFNNIGHSELDYKAISPMQIMSIGASTVPFVEHNDANRALMGSNMQRQTLPLQFAEAPLIGTGLEANVAQESGHVIKSDIEGIILNSCSSNVEILDKSGQIITYKLTKHARTNQFTYSNQSTIYWPGEIVYAGQVIADSSSTLSGEFAIGLNLLIGYMPWEGYNYEDAIIINEKLVKSGRLTSSHVSVYETELELSNIDVKAVSFALTSARKIRLLKKKYRGIKKMSKNAGMPAKAIIKLLQLFAIKIIGIKNEHKDAIDLKSLTPIIENSAEENLLSTKQSYSSNGVIKSGTDVNGGDPLVIKSFKVVSNNIDLQKEPCANSGTNASNNYISNFDNFLSTSYDLKYDCDTLQDLILTFLSLAASYSRLLNLKTYTAFQNNLCTCINSLLSLKFCSIGHCNILLKSKLLAKISNFSELLNKTLIELKKIKPLIANFSHFYKLLLQRFYIKYYKLFSKASIESKSEEIKNVENFGSSIKFCKKYSLDQVEYGALSASLALREYNIGEISKSNIELLSAVLTKNCDLFDVIIEIIFQSSIAKFGKSFSEIDQAIATYSKAHKNKEAQIKEESVNENKSISLELPLGVQGKVISSKIFAPSSLKKKSFFTCAVKVFIAETRKIQVGDKLSGRHGNKGVISKILPEKDMPSLPNGRSLDIALNPLGVPSRMNVGQLMESTLGLAALILGNRYKINAFDENYGEDASYRLASQALKCAALNSKIPWLYDTKNPGKVYVRDGRTGEFMDNPVSIGIAYILKLMHLVEDKMHSRSTGPYSKITEQPLQGKALRGGQRFGEMEVWALEAYGAANTLQEILTIKSDNIDSRNDLYSAVSKNVDKPNASFSETLACLICELKALGLDFQLFGLKLQPFESQNNNTHFENSEINVFDLLEKKLLLRANYNQVLRT